MSFSVHTFEVNTSTDTEGFAFHEKIGEGQDLYFLGKFPKTIERTASVAETIFGAIVDTFSKANTGDPYQTFEESLKIANQQAAKLGIIAPGADIVVAFFDFQNLYLSQSGDSEAYLLREQTISQISEPKGNEEKLFFNILSGQVSVDDIILLSVTRLLRSITNSELVGIFSEENFGNAVETLKQTLIGKSEEDQLITCIGVGKKESSSMGDFISKMVSKATPKKKEEIVPTKEPQNPTETTEQTQAPEPQSDIASMFPDENPTPMTTSNSESLLKKNITRCISRVKNINKQSAKKIAKITLGLVLLGFGIKFIANFESSTTKELRSQIQIATQAFDQSVILQERGEKEEAITQLETAKTAAQKVLNSESKTFRFEAQTILADIQNKMMLFERAKRVTPQLVADLGVVNSGLNAVGISNLNGNLYAYDTKSIYKTIRNVVEKGIPVSEKNSIIAGVSRSSQNTLVFLTDGPQVVEVRNGVIRALSTQDESWKKGIDLKAYGANYIYMLDPIENQIWKYRRQSSYYDQAIAYNQGADLSRSVSIAIDGAIYILSEDGNIQKLYQGVKAPYSFKNLPSVGFAGRNIKIYTVPDMTYLYILDPDNSRILVFSKGERFAEYKKQIVFDSISDVRDFVIDKNELKASIVTKDKIYEVPL